MTPTVFIIGGAQTDFARHWQREGLNIGDMLCEVVTQAADLARVDLHTVDSAHVGNFAAELFAQQGLLGALLAERIPAFRGLPIARHEAACASGSMAVLAGMKDILSGLADCVCVVGIEWMRNLPGDVAAAHLGCAAWHPQETEGVRYVWPQQFSRLADEYALRHGLDYAHLAMIAEQNYRNARANPDAQTRRWQFAPGSFSEDDRLNPVVAGRTRRNDCGQITDGAAALFLASEAAAADHARRQGISLDAIPRIKGWGHRSDRIGLDNKLDDSRGQPLILPMVRRTIDDAFRRAGLGLDAIDLIETHDCFAITQYMAIDHFGITAPGESWKAVADGRTAMGGDLPINPGGGLIGLGHPVGATGVRMVLDAWKQIAGRAGDCQVADAGNAAVLNLGGSAATIASFVVGI